MKRTERFLHHWTMGDRPYFRSFVLLSAAFVLGAFLGMLAASLLGEESCSNLKQFFASYMQLTPGGAYTWSHFFHTLWYFLRLPLLLFLVGFSALGVFVIPSAMLLKGFTFAFSVSALILLYGSSGLLAAAVFFGFSELLFIPILFLVAAWSQDLAGSIAFGRKRSAASLHLRGPLLVGAAILAISLVTFFSFRLLILLLPQYAA